MERMPEGEVIVRMEDARRFNKVMGKGPVQHEYRALARRAVALGVPPGGRVLDVGTGPGFVALEVARGLQNTRCEVVGMDLSTAMLTIAAENARREGLESVLTWREGDAKRMPFDEETFDVVVSSGSLHHWQEPVVVFDEIARVLKVGGRCIIRDSKRLQGGWSRLFARAIGLMVPPDFRVHYWNSIESSYTPEELRALLKRSRLTGWEIEEDLMDLLVVGVKRGVCT